MSQASSQSEIILGVDPGSQVTGYGIIHKSGQKLDVLDYGTIRPPKTFKLSDRYLIIHDSIYSLVEKWKPTSVSIETQYVAKNVQSALKLGMARCAIMIAAKRHAVAIYSYAPTKAKLAVTGHGSASKEQLQSMVQRLLNLSHKSIPLDASDALALAICHAHAAHWAEEI